MTWRFTDAKNRFSELFSRALSEGPQRVRRHNGNVLVISEKDYENLVARQATLKLQNLKQILARVDALPKDQSRTDDEILGHDETGIPG